MKRSELEKYLGKTVKVTLFNGDAYTGELHKTGGEQFRNYSNLYLPYEYYFLINCFKHKKINLIIYLMKIMLFLILLHLILRL